MAATTTSNVRDERPAAAQEGALPSAADEHALLWLHPFDDSVMVSAIAPAASGDVLVARSGVELVRLDAHGALRWKRPFGELVATAGERTVVAGRLEARFDFGGLELTPSGGSDVYLVELDGEGRALRGWAYGGAGDQSVQSLALGPGGRVLLSGDGLGTLLVEADGDVGWGRPFDGQVAFDADGNVLLAGALEHSWDFGGGPLVSADDRDVLVLKLAPNGEHLFSRSFGGAGEQRAQALSVDPAGNIVVAGVYEGELDLGDGMLPSPASGCPAEARCSTGGFVVKLDPAGQTVWSTARVPLRSIGGMAIASRPDAPVLLSGARPGGVSPYRTTWLNELDADGAQLWQRSEWPETGVGAGRAVAIDPDGNLFWPISVRPTLEADELAYVAKLSP